MNASPTRSRTRILSPGDPEPLIVQNAGGTSPLVLVCDHAGQVIPKALDGLGLRPGALDQHIGWDIGAGALASRLGERLDACVMRQSYSRLVIDCNRPPDHPELVPDVSDGTAVPANRDLAPEDIQARLTAIHTPYHAGIASLLDAREASGGPLFVVSVHSFTPMMNGEARPWHVGVLHEGDSALSRRMLSLLRGEDGLVVGDNQPYALGSSDYTVPLHAQARGRDYLELEVRQDLIAEASGQVRFADLLARLLQSGKG